MVGKPISKKARQQELSALKEKYLLVALADYRANKEKGVTKGRDRCCKDAVELCREETRTTITLDGETLRRRDQNIGTSIRDSNAAKGKLDLSEAKVLLHTTNESARRGFPFSQRRIGEHAELIINAHLHGDESDANYVHVGTCWAQRFTERFRDELKPYWSHSLDHSRARAVNSTTKAAYFSILEEAIVGDGTPEDRIVPELMYGVDESGFQSGIGHKERVYGPPGQSVQYQQRSGGRENITVIVTICGDKTSLPPAVIFKGVGFQVKWLQNNPLKALLGYSKKGYTTGQIGVEWLKNFDASTSEKAAGRRRLLLVDGHNSHYTMGFLIYAKEHRIAVVCYPSHSTHIYQGLDVVIFGPLKQKWGDARDEYERKHNKNVNKTNFLEVYATAHAQVLTEENIAAAFRKTGVIPFDPTVISEAAMAPSQATSLRPTTSLIPMSSPVKVMSDFIRDRAAEKHAQEAARASARDGSPSPSPIGASPSTSASFLTRTTFQSLAATESGRYLTSPTPIPSTQPPPIIPTFAISPKKRRYDELLAIPPSTPLEARLQEAIREGEDRYAVRKEQLIVGQAAATLTNAYASRLNFQLHESEEEKRKKRSKATLPVGNGMPVLLTADAQVAAVKKYTDDKAAKEDEKRARTALRQEKSRANKEQKAETQARVARNKAVTQQWKEEVEEWERERDELKAGGVKIRRKKPVRPPLEKPPGSQKKQRTLPLDEDDTFELEVIDAGPNAAQVDSEWEGSSSDEDEDGLAGDGSDEDEEGLAADGSDEDDWE